MKKITFPGIALCSLLALGPWAFALPLRENVEQKTQERGSTILNTATSPGEMIHGIRDAYLTPICEEWPYVDEKGDSVGRPRSNSLNVQKGTPLSEALDGVVARSSGMLRWERNHGSICVVGTGKGGKSENCLDTRIDLHVEKVSTWDALRAVAEAANEKPVNGRRIGIYPGFIQMRRHTTPEGLKDNPCITLDLKDVPARDAVCAIIAQAPFKMAYWYANWEGMGDAPPAAKLTMYIYKDNGQKYNSAGIMPDEECYSYAADYYEMVGDEKEAAGNRGLVERIREEKTRNKALEEQDEAYRETLRKAREEAQKEEAQTEAQ